MSRLGRNLKAPFPLLLNSELGQIRQTAGCLKARSLRKCPQTLPDFRLLRMVCFWASPGRTGTSQQGLSIVGAGLAGHTHLLFGHGPFKHILSLPLKDLLEKPHSFCDESQIIFSKGQMSLRPEPPTLNLVKAPTPQFRPAQDGNLPSREHRQSALSLCDLAACLSVTRSLLFGSPKIR